MTAFPNVNNCKLSGYIQASYVNTIGISQFKPAPQQKGKQPDKKAWNRFWLPKFILILRGKNMDFRLASYFNLSVIQQEILKAHKWMSISIAKIP